jgi:hypothetical membrane protein
MFGSRRTAFRLAGALLFLAGALALMGIITGEIFYPQDYTTANSEISDLGATRPPDSVTYQPSATIFNTTMIVAGLLVLVGAVAAQRAHGSWWSSVPLALMGVGMAGVGVFPGNNADIHPLFAMLTFIAGGVAAILSAVVVRGPFRLLAPLLGLVALASLFGAVMLIPILGDGGTERWVAYPILLWITGFGGYLLGAAHWEG